MTTAWIDGEAAEHAAAIAAAAGRIRASRHPLFTGDYGDVATTRALLRLAAQAGGAVDQQNAAAALGWLSVLRETGSFVGAPAEIRRRADMLLFVGPKALQAAPELADFVLTEQPDLGRGKGGPRRVLWLGGPAALPDLPGGGRVEAVACAPGQLRAALSMLRAGVSGQRFGKGPLATEVIHALAATLREARFGALVFAASDLDELDLEMLLGLVADLNAETRWTTLPLSGDPAAFGAAQVATWTAGWPLRLGFGRGVPEHDLWRFDGARLAASGECDLVVHLGSGEADLPEAFRELPLIAVTSDATAWRSEPAIRFTVAPTSAGHLIRFNELWGSFVAAAPGAASDRPSPAELLDGIAEALDAASQEEAA
ncbi:hypothetical protein NPA31_011470 [Aurantimonas sp. MSK8Z-1]|uniref:hypothetical protein n=1 Tax=Mangrovibrevibacter kandeliae TaxID=2968473 RepID=UPI002117C910|nr:hypothetical protein [Aurantimonas sp. MSK8Z-1]MCW4115582.1 hypothetical protein [Aurantimonas sp. MSK8Z-1]